MHAESIQLCGYIIWQLMVEALAGKRARFYASREPAGRRIDLEGLLSLPAEGVHVYVCGPRGE